MKRLSLIAVLVGGCASAPKAPAPSTQRADESYDLENGLPVIQVVDSSLPTLKLILEFGLGADLETAENEGGVALLACLMERGSGGRSAMEMAEEVEGLGLEVSVSAGRSSLTVSASGLKRHMEKIVQLALVTARKPNLADDEFERCRREQMAGFVQQRSQPSSLASKAMLQMLYGADRMGRPVSGRPESVSVLSKAQLTELYGRIVSPNHLTVGLIGDLEVALAKPLLERSLGDWTPKLAFQPNRLTDLVDGPRIHIVHKPDLSQATVLLAHDGITRADPRWEAVQVMNFVLGGGGFSSRLMKLVRSEKGLTYGIRSSFSGGHRGGPFTIRAATRKEKVRELIDLTLGVVKDLRDNGVSKEDLAQAKSYLLGSFPLKLETPEGEGGLLMMARRYGLGDDYLAAYPDRISAVDETMVRWVAREVLKPGQFRIVVVGPRESIYQQLRDLGHVTASHWQDDRPLSPAP